MATPVDDHERFMRLFLAHERTILRTVLIYVPHEADAYDIVQETAVALWKRFPEYDPERPFVNWACGFARLEVRRFRKRAARLMLSEEAVGALMSSEDRLPPEQAQRERFLAECRQQLPPEHRSVLDGYYLKDEPVEVLAQKHERSVDAIYKLLQRTRRALLECIERKHAEIPT
jgi:RNA polymerase sigma-70 factor, ECF subfamily